MSKLKPLFIQEQYEIPPILPNTPERSDIPTVEPILNTVTPVTYEPVVNAVESPATPPVVVADAKSPLKSKINWLGIVLTLIGALQLVQEGPLLDTLIPDQDARAKVSAGVLFLGGILTVVLRSFFTYRPTTVTNVNSNVE